MRYRGFGVVLLLGVVLAFFMGRKSVKRIVEVEYRQGEVKGGSVNLNPVSVSIPRLPLLLFHTDTVTLEQVVDTVGIIEDWITRRDYKEVLFDDTTGKMELDFSVQYNEVKGLDYRFTPIHQVRTIKEVKAWVPFVSGSYNSFNMVGVGGGVFYHDLGFEYCLLQDFRYRRSGHSFGIKYRF